MSSVLRDATHEKWGEAVWLQLVRFVLLGDPNPRGALIASCTIGLPHVTSCYWTHSGTYKRSVEVWGSGSVWGTFETSDLNKSSINALLLSLPPSKARRSSRAVLCHMLCGSSWTWRCTNWFLSSWVILWYRLISVWVLLTTAGIPMI
eukprot:3819566-Amphidinium_carterae.1